MERFLMLSLKFNTACDFSTLFFSQFQINFVDGLINWIPLFLQRQARGDVSNDDDEIAL
jgi:hypothetical protein